MTGRENLWYFGQLYDVPRAVLRRRIDELLATVGLVDAADTLVERYSRGMRQRLSIARGLINDPSYLLLDEPTLGPGRADRARPARAWSPTWRAAGVGRAAHLALPRRGRAAVRHVYVIDRGAPGRRGQPGRADRRHPAAVRGRADPGRGGAGRGRRGRRARRAGRAPRCCHDADDEGRPRVTVRHPDDLAGEVTTAVVRAGGAIVRVEVTPPTLEDAILAMAAR